MPSSQNIADQIKDLMAYLARMKAEIAQKFIGQKSVINLNLTALLSGAWIDGWGAWAGKNPAREHVGGCAGAAHPMRAIYT